MSRLERKEVQKIKPYIPGKPIEEVKRELGLKKVIKMASNESPFGPSPSVIKAITKQSAALNRYPEGDCFYLRKKLAKKIGVSEEQLTFGNGSDEIIILAIRAFVNPGDEIVISDPTFLIYEIASKIAGAKVKKVAFRNFKYDLVAMKKAITRKTKIVFIANPDNPIGTYVNETEVRTFLKGLPKDLIIFFDEAYYEIVNKKNYPNTLKFLRQKKNIIITRTFSKAYGLAGLRIGYGISQPKIAKCLNSVREPFNVNSLAQAAALKSLEDKKYLKRLRKTIIEGREFICENIKEMGLEFVPSVTNFVLINLKKDSTEVFKQLLRKGIIVRDMKNWNFKTYIRVTIGRKEENKKFINALRRII